MREVNYSGKGVSPSSQPEHLDQATKFAQNMIECYDALQLSEILKIVKQQFMESLQREIENSHKKIDYIRDSVDRINAI